MTNEPIEIGARAIQGRRWGPSHYVYDEYRIDLRAAIAALEASGWRLVGPEPTEAMLNTATWRNDVGWRHQWQENFRAALRVAPRYGSQGGENE